MAFFAVEVDYYRREPDGSAVLVPRAAFVPSWITGPAVRPGGPTGPKIVDASPEFREMVARMDELADEMGLQIRSRATGRNYLPPVLEDGVRYATSGFGVYASARGVEINLSVLRDLGKGEVADEILAHLEAVTGISLQQARVWPAVPYASLLQDWARTRSEVIEPYFRARTGSMMRSPGCSWAVLGLISAT